MDELPSTTFRKVYASLKAPVVVTVSGHPIGTYVPISTAIDARYVEAIRPGEPTVPEPHFSPTTATALQRMGDATRDFAVQEFRPVPKPSQRGK